MKLMQTRFALLAALVVTCAVGCEESASTDTSATTTSENAASEANSEAAATPEEAINAGVPFAVTEESFETVVLNSEIPVMVDVWAEWCGPCLALAPTVEELAADYAGKALVAKLDLDQANALAARYEISGIPALLFFHNGEVVAHLMGSQTTKAEMAAELDKIREMAPGAAETGAAE